MPETPIKLAPHWQKFLAEVDQLLTGPAQITCIGGFVMTEAHGASRSTGDLDLIESNSQVVEELQKIAGEGSELHKKHKLYVEYVGVVTMPLEFSSRLDEDLVLLDRIAEACREVRNPNLARGYFAGVSEVTHPKLPSEPAGQIRKRLNESLDALWEGDAVLAFHVMTLAGDFVQSFDRAIDAVRSKRIRAGFLHTFVAWNGPRHTWPKEARTAAETLLEAAVGGDEDAANTGIEFIVFVLMRTTESEDKLHWCRRCFTTNH